MRGSTTELVLTLVLAAISVGACGCDEDGASPEKKQTNAAESHESAASRLDVHAALRRFDLFGDDYARKERVERLKSIWDSLPVEGRVDALVDVALDSQDALRYVAAAVLGTGDRHAGRSAVLKCLSSIRDFRGEPVTAGWLVFYGADDFDAAVRAGLDLLDRDDQRVAMAGHVSLVLTTMSPIEPDPRAPLPQTPVVDRAVWAELRLRRPWTASSVLGFGLQHLVADRKRGKPPTGFEAEMHGTLRMILMRAGIRDQSRIDSLSSPDEIRELLAGLRGDVFSFVRNAFHVETLLR